MSEALKERLKALAQQEAQQKIAEAEAYALAMAEAWEGEHWRKGRR